MSQKKPTTPQEMGRKGGLSRSEKKVAAARRNAVISAYLRKKKKGLDKSQALG